VGVFLVRQLGERRARDLLLSARLVAASEACELGLVDEVVAP
jgi:methylglutaconyl-CoA hydratase